MKHEKITEEFIGFIEEDDNLKRLVEKSLAKGKKINPDLNTNPCQSLSQLYDFLDWSSKCMPWSCLKDVKFPSLYQQIDQSTGYFWFIFDQPLEELEGKGFYYPSLQYLEPIASWIKKYSKAWGEYLSKEDSWNDEYYRFVLEDENFCMKKGWYGDKNIWKSFNDFFSRKLIDKNVRHIADVDVVSPADSYPKGFYKIDENGRLINPELNVKSANFNSIQQLIGDDSKYCQSFAGGTLTHTFLDIHDYHRYHFPVSGVIKEIRKISGVNAGGGITQWNEREKRYQYFNEIGFQMIETRDCLIVDTEQFGLVAILPIGMSQICSCNIEENLKVGLKVEKGDSLGYFMFGGSDIVMIFQSSVELIDLTGISTTKEGHILMGQPYAKIKRKS